MAEPTERGRLARAYDRVTDGLGFPADDLASLKFAGWLALEAKVSVETAHAFLKEVARGGLETETERLERSYPIDGLSRSTTLVHDGLTAPKKTSRFDALVGDARSRVLRISRRLREGRKLRAGERDALKLLVGRLRPTPPSYEEGVRAIAAVSNDDQIEVTVDGYGEPALVLHTNTRMRRSDDGQTR